MTFKVTIIGAGSVGFTKKLCSDLLKVPEFEDIEIALNDRAASGHVEVNGPFVPPYDGQ